MFNKDIREEMDAHRMLTMTIVDALKRADAKMSFLEREMEEAKEAINTLLSGLGIGIVDVEGIPAHKELVCIECEEVNSSKKRGRPRKNK